jgi:O-succinylbenzoic acid--CoA ligase
VIKCGFCPEVVDDIRKDIDDFLQEWKNDSDSIVVRTSGSTGSPKEMRVLKRCMDASAEMTCRFLGLKRGDRALLCLPVRYIAGKMVIVRAEHVGMELIATPPSGNPLADISDDEDIHLASMIPLQVYNSLKNPIERVRMAKIKNIIIGGGPIDKAVEEELRSFPNNIYHSYGMTETVSHIALRRLSGDGRQDRYYPFDNVEVSLSVDGTLVINAPELCPNVLVTNDMADIAPDGSFVVLGRRDNIINSGGVKIQIEKVEEKLLPIISSPFAITSVKNAKFGEIVVLIVEGEDIDIASLEDGIVRTLEKYERPKRIIKVDFVPMTPTGKINRPECARKAAYGMDNIYLIPNYKR